MNFLTYRPGPALRALYWSGLRARFGNWRRTFYASDPRPVPLRSREEAVSRYGGICRRLQSCLEHGPELRGATVCELGAGQCLATSALFLGLGARRVEVFEPYAPVIDALQREVLGTLRAQGLPLRYRVNRDRRSSAVERGTSRVAPQIGGTG